MLNSTFYAQRKINSFKIPNSNISARDLLNLITLKITYEDINCIKYRRIVYMTWDNMLGMYRTIDISCVLF